MCDLHPLTFVNFATFKAAAKLELFFNKPQLKSKVFKHRPENKIFG